eukprot:TRINITY_DN917_c0_g2_i2.p1 TRINITY_DN917_c0_g2~~TRINITY_DN917_c0_g2_i2.p1  ORF type:complete len:836 (+),score=187.63 TRINITY_DN917_c0_g2_i2:294-2801(+)
MLDMLGSEEMETGSESDWMTRGSSTALDAPADKETEHATILYIQMEYCPRTLRQMFETLSAGPVNKDVAWRTFRQIVEGLVHIHAQGIIHRDLTPNNIFFDPRGDVKIGDFGLAKFTNLEGSSEMEANSPAMLDPHVEDPGQVPRRGSTTGQVGTYFYTAPEIEQGWPHTDEKVDMYSLGVVLFELWHPFDTAMERVYTLTYIKKKGKLPDAWAQANPQVAALVCQLIAAGASARPTAALVLKSELMPPRMEDEALEGVLRTIQSGESGLVLDRVVAAVFDPERIRHAQQVGGQAPEALAAAERASVKRVGPRDSVVKAVRRVFERHGAVGTQSRSVDTAQGALRSHSAAVKVVDELGHVHVLRHEMRMGLARWIAASQTLALKRYEVAPVYRKGAGRSAPHEYFQGDFDVVGGDRPLAEAEAIKVALEILEEFPQWEGLEIRLSHRDLLTAIWSWAGVAREDCRGVAQLLAVLHGTAPRSAARKEGWPSLKAQLLQGLKIPSPAVDRLQAVELRLSGAADEALPRLRGALPASVMTSAALDELAALLGYLRVWGVDDKRVSIDALMAPSEDFFNGVFFQLHARRAGGAVPAGAATSAPGGGGGGTGGPAPRGGPLRGGGSTTSGISKSVPCCCMAVGGRYDHLIKRLWPAAATSASPGAVGVSIAVQKLIIAASAARQAEGGLDGLSGSELLNAGAADVLVCSRGGGGLLTERMEVVAELWEGGIKADYVCAVAPSLTEQYEYATACGIHFLVILGQAALAASAAVKVRHLEKKSEEEVPRSSIVKFLTEAIAGSGANAGAQALSQQHQGGGGGGGTNRPYANRRSSFTKQASS